jgi:hypothetical protein
MSTAQPSPLAIPLTMRSSAAASNLIFLPPLHLLTTLCRLRLNSSVPFHGPSCPSPSRPTPARICHLSPVIRSARPTCRTVRSTPPAMRRRSLRKKSSSCCSFSPRIRRRWRRRVASASSHSNRNRKAGLPLLRLVRPRPVLQVPVQRRRLRVRMRGNAKAQRGVRSDTPRVALETGGTAVSPLCSAW